MQRCGTSRLPRLRGLSDVTLAQARLLRVRLVTTGTPQFEPSRKASWKRVSLTFAAARRHCVTCGELPEGPTGAGHVIEVPAGRQHRGDTDRLHVLRQMRTVSHSTGKRKRQDSCHKTKLF